MAKSPEEMAQSMIDNVPAKTGKSLGEWLEIVATTDLKKHGQIVEFLKGHHGMTHGFANLVAHKALEAASGATPDLLTAQYEKKPDLRTIYDAVVAAFGQFGEAEVSVKKTYVSLRRRSNSRSCSLRRRSASTSASTSRAPKPPIVWNPRAVSTGWSATAFASTASMKWTRS